MSTSNVNGRLTIDERNDVRQSIVKAEAELQRLLDHQKRITTDLSQLKKMLVIHRILPRETIGQIFSTLCTEKISIPHKRYMIPPQILISHVCSEWRAIALATPGLWNVIEILRPSDDRWVRVATELLFNRARMRRVNLTLDMRKINRSRTVGKLLRNIILPLHVKHLHLSLPISALESVTQGSDDIIGNVDEISLNVTGNSSRISITLGSDPATMATKFLNRIRSLAISEASSASEDYPSTPSICLTNLPWAQMRCLYFDICINISTLSQIFRISTALVECRSRIIDDAESGSTTVLTVPQLYLFHIFLKDSDSERILRSFQCPNLRDFKLEIEHWTPETYKIIEDHYNLHRLLSLNVSRCPYPISKVLLDAPMLEQLIITHNVFMDERTLQGISSGELGRFLISLGFKADFDVGSVLDMVASRQGHVKQVVEMSRSWQDHQISGIKRLFVLDDDSQNYALFQAFKGKADELKRLGVIVYMSEVPL